ncbi:hypothetical protein BGX33_007783 [Mortierella sp. NVP41]|nr:hypothetical protein BGX33_007783 [Mortierella sp. NVP41]
MALVVIGTALNTVKSDAVPAIDKCMATGTSVPFLYNETICTTPQCHTMASQILNDLNPQADPCQDFSQFVCGGFYDKHEIPADQPTTDYFWMLLDQNNQAIRSIVDPSVGKTLTSAGDTASQANLQKLQDLYASCMNKDAILNAGRKPVINQIQTILASFPSLSIAEPAAPADKTVLSKTLAQLLNCGLSGVVTISVVVDPTNPLIHSLQLTESGLGLPSKEYYQEQDTLRLYGSTIAQMFQIILGDEDIVPNNRAQPLTDADVKEEWKEAAKDVLVDRYDPIKSNNPRTVEELTALTPSIDWLVLISEVLPAGVTSTRPIVVESPTYLAGLNQLLQRASPTTLRHYFTWVAIKGLGLNLGLSYRRPLQVLKSALSGIAADIQPPRWKDCVAVINTNLGQMAGHFFVQETFKGDSRQSVMAIVDSLLETYTRTFPTLTWLDEPTRAGALQKLNAIIQLIGYSTDSPDVSSSISLQSYYSDLTISRDDYFGNQLRFAVWNSQRSMRELNKPVNRRTMNNYPQIVDAFYDASTNHMVFPAGILQPPFFHVDNPEYINYGAMGVVAGHEIIWWTNTTEQAFDEKMRCFVEQYGNFAIEGPDGKDYNINGELTLAENIADNGGVKQAFSTWQCRLKSDPTGTKYKNFKLPGLEKYTPEQLFFISYARLWCSKERPEYLMQLIRGNAHSPWKWRINGVVQNSADFATAFRCPIDSPMNPVRKCQVW